MIDFYFDRVLKLKDLLDDCDLVFLTDNGWKWYGLKEYPEKTALALFTSDDGYITFGCGHDAALPVVFHLYEKKGIKFHDDLDLRWFDIVCENYAIDLSEDEWNTINEYTCLIHMKYYLNPGCSLYDRIEREIKECEPKYNEIMVRSGIDKIQKEEEKNREQAKEWLERNTIINKEDNDLPF